MGSRCTAAPRSPQRSREPPTGITYVSSTTYSLEWQGAKRDYNTLANNQVQRWYDVAASGMSWGICGKSLYYAIRTEYQWGDCGNRSH